MDCFNSNVFKKFRNPKLEKSSLSLKTLDLKVDHITIDKVSGLEVPIKNRKYQSYIMKTINKIN